jgi:hypothetical protein
MGFPDGNYARAAWLSSVREVDREWQVDRREKRFGLIQAIRTGYEDVSTRTYVNSARGRAPRGASQNGGRGLADGSLADALVEGFVA